MSSFLSNEILYVVLCVCMLSHFSCVRLFATLWTAACQAPLSTAFSRQEHWSGLPCPPPGDLPNPGVEPRSPALQVDFLLLSHWGSPMQFSGLILLVLRIYNNNYYYYKYEALPMCVPKIMVSTLQAQSHLCL